MLKVMAMPIAGDTGGAIKGKKIDIFVPSHKSAIQWGRKTVESKNIKISKVPSE